MSDPFGTDPFESSPGGFPPPVRPSTVTPCGNGVRLGASLLDLLLFIVTCGIGWLVWWVVLWQQSTTPGKKMLGLRIVDLNTGAPATMQQMLLRELVGTILDIVTSGLVTLVSAVLVLVTPTRQAVWDYLARTTVVKES
ncbi:MAG: RDD family protein [Actinomycetota bacterium]